MGAITCKEINFCPNPDLQFLHTPGHTQGSACFLLNTRAGRLLFCGDIVAINDSGEIDTEVEEGEIPRLPSTLSSWSKVVEHDFDALIPLHTFADCPVPFIAKGGKEALKKALAEVSAWWDQAEKP